MKNIIKLCLALSAISVFVLSCTPKKLHKDKKKPWSPNTSLNENASETPDYKSSKDTESALKDVLKVLHAPYEAGDCFFKVIFSTPSRASDAATIVKQGSDSTITDAAGTGAGSTEGQGTYTITATGAPVKADSANFAIPDTVTYEYKDYQPKGSHIIINGKIETERQTAGQTTDQSHLLIKKGKYSLKITGLYEAELIFDASNRKTTNSGVLRDAELEQTGDSKFCVAKTALYSFEGANSIKLTFTYKNGAPLTLEGGHSESASTTLLKSFLKVPASK